MQINVQGGPSPSAAVSIGIGAAGQERPAFLWFEDAFGPVKGLVERVSDVTLVRNDGSEAPKRKIAAGERLSLSNYRRLTYSVDLRPQYGQFGAGHISWANGDGGVLMLGDLLPTSLENVIITSLQLPAGWTAVHSDSSYSSELTLPERRDWSRLKIRDVGNAVILIGPSNRERLIWSGGSRILFVPDMPPQFHVDEGLSAAAAIVVRYNKIFKTDKIRGYRHLIVGLRHFPVKTDLGVWEADTRGSTVTLVSSDMPFASQARQRLNEQLRHELFHIWIPNGLDLDGNYDWFYEGFALYESLKTGVALNTIRFDDMLTTIDGAYEVDASGEQRSLLELSKGRWSGDASKMHARGLLVAFQADLAILGNSRGKRSIETFLGELYTRHRVGTPSTDGTSAIMAFINEQTELRQIAGDYIQGSKPVDRGNSLAVAGLEMQSLNGRSQLAVTSKPDKRQKEILDQLGYNNWRNSTERR